MSGALFSIEQIKTVAFNALSDSSVPDDLLAQNFRGMHLLISALESEAKSLSELQEIDTPPSTPVAPVKPKKEAPLFSGYGARLKKETFERLLTARKNGVTVSTIASKEKGLTEAEVFSALKAEKLPNERWEVIASALDVLDKEAKDGE